MNNEQIGETLVSKIESGSGVIWFYLPGGDEGFCERAIERVTEGIKATEDMPAIEPLIDDMGCYFWDAVQGASWNQGVTETGELTEEAAALKDPLNALLSIPEAAIEKRHGVFVMRDLHTYFNHESQFGVRRGLAELAKHNRLNNKNHMRVVIVMADTPTPHAAIKDYCDVLDFELPNYAEMEQEAYEFVRTSIITSSDDVEAATRITTCSADLKDKIIRSLLGTSSEEAQRILAYAASICRGLNENVLDVIAKEKAKVIRKVEGLTYIPYEKIPDASHFAGFDAFLPWLQKRGRAYTRHAQEVGQELPRGAVLIGPPGTGKTEIAKAAAKILGLDLIVMDIGAMFDKYVGGTERKIRNAIQMVDAMPQCAVLVDEIDKVFAGAHENQGSDSGVSSRMLSTFLSWLSDRDTRSRDANRTFVIVTMNRIAGVPPEFLRAGRFDKVWSTDLPDQATREQIFAIHLQKRGIDAAQYGKALKTLAGPKLTADFVGAEIEEVVRSARADAYHARMACWENAGQPGAPPTAKDVEPTIEELMAAADDTVPLATLSGKEIKNIREFCRTRTTPVSGKPIDKQKGATREKRRVETGRAAAASAN